MSQTNFGNSKTKGKGLPKGLDMSLSNAGKGGAISLKIKDKQTIRSQPDIASLLGLIMGFVFVIGAIIFSGSPKAYLTTASISALLVVLGGTIAITTISFSLADIRTMFSCLGKVLIRRIRDPKLAAEQILEMSYQARMHSPLALEGEISRIAPTNNFLAKGLMMLTEGMPLEELDHILTAEIATERLRKKNAAAVLQRGAEVAPAMGLIGTMIGLVQLLSGMSDPSTSQIGPAMAIAILTTFYGIILGNMLFAPLGAKLEKMADDDCLIHQIYKAGIESIIKEENPRRLELVINTLLPQHLRIRYFE